MRFLLKLLLLYFLISSSKLHANELKLASAFSDHMVLQREKPISVWGHASPSSDVSVDFAGQSKSTTAQADGSWQIQLDQMPASGDSRRLTVSSLEHLCRPSHLAVDRHLINQFVVSLLTV
jgi:sialate O-acetylesterase